MGEFTYELLFDVVRRERARDELQDIGESFYADVESYVNTLEEEIRSMDPLDQGTDTIRTQLINSKKLLREVYDRREKKILILALNKARTQSSLINTSSLLPIEKPLFDQVLSTLEAQRKALGVRAPLPPKKTVYSPPKKHTPTPEPTEDAPALEGGVFVKITASVPKFLGANGETHGPFSPGHEVALPEQIAKILVKKGRAEEV